MPDAPALQLDPLARLDAPFDDGALAGESPPLLRSSTAGALVAIALLVAATVGAAVWLSVLDDRRQAQERLTRTAHQLALQLRGRLVETEQLLLLEGSNYASSARRFRADMEELLAANPALMRVELRARDGGLREAVDATPPRPSLPQAARGALGPEARAAFDTAARLNRLTYSHAYYARFGETGFDLLELVVPTGEIDGPMIVASYAPQRMLDHLLTPDPDGDALVSLVEPDGAVVARHASLGRARTGLHALAPLARTGNTLQVRVDGLQSGTRFVPNAMIGLVAATSVGLGIAMFFLVQDVRRRARVERALREQVQFRRSVENAMQHALLVYGPDGRCVHVNEATCRISGWTDEELVGLRPPMPFSTPESRRDLEAFRERVANDVAAGRDGADAAALGFETVLRSKSGDPVPMMVYETAMRDADGRPAGTMVLGVDLREQKRVEELARRQNEALQARSRLATLGEMASTLSHELNQPLAAVTSYAAACENLIELQPLRPDPIRQALRGIKTQAERAGQVIRSVQSFLKRRAIERSETDLSVLVRGLEPLLRLQAARTGARIDIDVPPGTVVFADRIMLEQVLLNLTRNGFEAMADMPEADRVLELCASDAGDERGERVQVRVIDRGRGVPPEVVPQLFTAFFTTKREGMGLGLSLCRSVIEQHGGRLVYRPRPEGGSIFEFNLPRRAEGGPAPSPAPNPIGDAP